MQDAGFIKLVVFINGLVPLALLLWDLYRKRAGANPLEFATHTTGMLALLFLIGTLAITPLRVTFRLNWLVKLRRMLGLFAFFYGLLHLVTYIWFDQFFNLREVIKDIGKRPFVAVGMAAFVMMLPLALTSTNKMIKRLGGKRWGQLHRLVYMAAIAGVIHFWMLVKADTRLPVTFGFILLLLLGHRLFVKYYPSERGTERATPIPPN
ncbi:MAG TPA: protein-methionine-sulfoxide reductase heme-binding subunit MsrQ [Pyrinomonadaceae bacterium]|nr:protein-methionine-sulfoxide reductase heme-binding subunit MsrQ [Pyrinomonadaceae bacterium]